MKGALLRGPASTASKPPLLARSETAFFTRSSSPAMKTWTAGAFLALPQAASAEKIVLKPLDHVRRGRRPPPFCVGAVAACGQSGCPAHVAAGAADAQGSVARSADLYSA
jgi:hypothetical protein